MYVGYTRAYFGLYLGTREVNYCSMSNLTILQATNRILKIVCPLNVKIVTQDFSELPLHVLLSCDIGLI